MKPGGSVPCSRRMNPVYSLHPISFEYILILSSYLRLGLPHYFIPSVFSTKTLYALLPPTWDVSFPFHSLRFENSNNIQ